MKFLMGPLAFLLLSNATMAKKYRELGPQFYNKSYTEIEYPYVSILDGTKDPAFKNDMQIINNGLAALYKRIEMIKRAKSSIELEYFIFEPKEYSTQLILKNLILKAKAGVKVRILVDKSSTIFAFTEDYVKAIKDYLKRFKKDQNFEVRYYNDNSKISLSTMNFRNHRKTFIIDREEAITGGRNIEDKYFDLDKSYNFVDRDIWIKGLLVSAMKDSFNKFWEHDISERYKAPKKEKFAFVFSSNRKTRKRVKKYDKWLKDKVLRSTKVNDLEKNVMIVGKENYEKTKIRTCDKATFVSDRPGANGWKRLDFVGGEKWYNLWGGSESYKEKYIVTERAIGEFIYKANKSVTISSPYFLLNPRARAVKDYLHENQIKVSVFTNSLKSTDAFYVSSRFYDDAYEWVKEGIDLFVHSGKYIENGMKLIDQDAKITTWGTHSKTQIYDDDKFYIGTYNIDNRSAFYNTEMGVFCEGNIELTKDVSDSIYERAERHGLRIIDRKTAEEYDGSIIDIHGENVRRREILRIKALEGVLRPFEFLM